MDTIGAIHPKETHQGRPDVEQRREALERLRYSAMHSRCAVLVGRRDYGKSQLLEQLASELDSDGYQVAQIQLAGLTATDLLPTIAAELGLGLEATAPAIDVWMTLTGFAKSYQRSGTNIVMLFDQLDRADASIAPQLERLLSLFENVVASLFATRPKLSKPLRAILKNHCWLRIELERLSKTEATRLFTEQVSQHSPELEVAFDATETALDVTEHRLERLKQLAALAALAAESEQSEVLNRDIIESLQSEGLLRK